MLYPVDSARVCVCVCLDLQLFLSLFFFSSPSAKHFKKTFLSVSAHQASLLWGLSDTRHKLWLWMAPWWPQCSCGTGAQTHIEAYCFIAVHKHAQTQTHMTFNLTELQSWYTLGFCDVWFDYYGELPAVFVLGSCSSDTRQHTLCPTHSLKHKL